jgi:malate dehydrogenase (oxaloacetate-decarboxylating)(NADP+)
MFLGLSAAGVLKPEMVGDGSSQAADPGAGQSQRRDHAGRRPAVRPDAMIATGRSDYPNQVNNVLCFPFIFRGALDVRRRRSTRR